ncbi:MAG: glutamate cyclase domain-containing protein [Candidatus Bathyarchaeia archaeon]
MSGLEEQLLVGFGDVVDRIVSTPAGTAPVIRKGRRGPRKLRYQWMLVYDEARKRYGRPLTLLAAERLKEDVGEGDHVLIVTNSHEMDGSPGAAALARALILGLRAIPVIVANYEEHSKYERAIPQACIGAQLIPITDPEALRGSIWTPYTVLIRNWPPMSVTRATCESEKFLEAFEPKAVITVEATSCNRRGVRHGALGTPRNSGDPEEEIVRWNELLDAANERGILTIATGDNGNECGFATIEDILRRHHEFCADCGCPCGGGIVSASGADIVIPANSSNWACYGIEACLAGILRRPEVMHDEYTHNRILLNCANVGIPDGASAMCTPTTDGASHEACIYTVGQLRQTVIMSSVELVRESR